ncbi:MAG: DUF1015 domain-containing protein [Clostridia bacterium]|nr:DUF1015 domain-containing protein [Clostridia bacterium]
MAHVIPYRALRYTEKAGDLKALACPPYDIISEEQRKAYLSTNPHNIIRLELPRDGENPYTVAGETLKNWLKEGILAEDEAPAFYVYDITFTDAGEQKHIAGLVGRVQLREFSDGVVLPHEETLSKAKADRLQLMQATGCNFSDIYSLYRAEEPDSPIHDVMRLVEGDAPVSEFTDDEGLTHRLWAVTDPEKTAAITKAFEDKKLYIADGHHRYETALNYRRWLQEQGETCPDADYCMMMLVEMSHPGLVVYPTHRMLRDLSDFSAENLLCACADYFTVEKMPIEKLDEGLNRAYAAHQKAFGFVSESVTALLTLKDVAVMNELLPDLSPVSRQLDVTVLHTLILERLLKIDKENMAKQINLSYTRDADEAIEAVKTGVANACFLLNPTRVSEIGEVAAAGEKMPQKSTYFYPKLITGLTMNRIR